MFKKSFPNVFRSAAPLCYYLKLLGLFPASFIGDIRNGRMKVAITGKVHSIFTCIIWFSAVVYGIIQPYDEKEYTDLSSLLIKVWYYATLFGSFAILVSMIRQICVFDKILDIFKAFHDFDEKVSSELKRIFF
jgi:hypothetical protein